MFSRVCLPSLNYEYLNYAQANKVMYYFNELKIAMFMIWVEMRRNTADLKLLKGRFKRQDFFFEL